MVSRVLPLLISVTLTGANPAWADPAPVMTRLSTGSEVAVWTLPAAAAAAKVTPVVFLHGGPGLYTEARRFAEGAPLRAAGFTTVYFDQAGGGRSARLPAAAYSLDRAVGDLEALRIALGKDRLVLWGNSWGASLATVYASRFPNRVAGLILTSPGMFPGMDGKRDYRRTNRDKVTYKAETIAAIAKIDSQGASAETTLPQDRAGKLFDELVASELIEAMVCKKSTARIDALPGGGNLYANRLLSRGLKTVKLAPMPANVPTVVIRGACDFLQPANAERYRAAFGGALVTIANDGHGLIENRTATGAALGAFANDVLSKTVK